MVRKGFLWVLLVIFLTTFVVADQTQLYSKIYLNPYYREATTANTAYNYTLQVNPPDGLTQVYSATITFEALFSPSVNISLRVNNQTCNTPNYYISTTYAGSAQMTASFDCSNIITQAGNYSVEFKTNKNTGAINGWLDLTYTNKPKPTMEVFGTEYQIGQQAKAWLQLLDSNGTYINDGVCFIDIYSPDNSEYVEHAQMFSMNHDGIYYYDLPAPETEGVYPVIARCYYEATSVKYYATAYYLNIGTLDGGWVATNLELIDGDKVKFKEADVAGVKRLDIVLNVTNMSSCLGVSEALLTGIEVYAYGKFDSENYDHITLSVYNYTSASWQSLPNRLLENPVWKSASNALFFNNLTTSGLYNESLGGLKIRFTDTNLTDGGASTLELDQFYVSCNQLSNPVWQEVMGSSEMHISNTTNIINGVWDYLLDVIMPYLEQIWNKLLGIESQLNTTINITNQTLINTETLLNITGMTFNNTGDIIDLINELNISIINSTNTYINNSNSLIIDNLTGLIEENIVQNLRFVGGAEYVPTQQGKAVVQFLDKNLDPVNTATPYIRLFYPDGSLFINWTAMGLVGNGIYELNFTAPAIYGVYIADAYATLITKTYYVSHTFHISEPENTSILVALNSTNLLVQNATTNISSDIASLRQNTTQSFDLTWAMIQALNSSQGDGNSVILSYLQNITDSLNDTHSQMLLINQSLSEQIQNTTNLTQELIFATNTSTQQSFDEVQDYLNNLTFLIQNNHNLTQENITTLTEMLLSINTSITFEVSSLNTTLYDVRADILQEINDTYNYMVAVNESLSDQMNNTGDEIIGMLDDMNGTIVNINTTNNWILEQFNISTDDLNMVVTAPNMCLIDTNWIARAQVKDRYGNILSYLDGVECNMTTDLWGAENMTYSFYEDNFKYIHLCDPAYTTFNWSVNCERVN